MPRVFLADSLVAERSAFRVLLADLHMELVGECWDWITLTAMAGMSSPDMILLSGDLLPNKDRLDIEWLRLICPKTRIVMIVNKAIGDQPINNVYGADAIITKDDFPQRVAGILRITMEEKSLQRI